MKREQCAEITSRISGMYAMHFESRGLEIQWFLSVFDVVFSSTLEFYKFDAYQLEFFSFQRILSTLNLVLSGYAKLAS